MFYRWRYFLPKSVQIAPVLLPGREGRYPEPPCDDLQTAVASVLAALAGRFGQTMPERGWILFGHSMGALLAHQIASQAARYGLPAPATLIVSSCPAPHQLPRPERLHELPDDELLVRLIHRYGFTGDDAEREAQLMRLMLPTIRGDLRMFERFEFDGAPPLDVPLAALGGADDLQVTRSDLQGWRERTTAPFRTRCFPGGHFYLLARRPPLADFLCQIILAAIGPDPSSPGVPEGRGPMP